VPIAPLDLNTIKIMADAKIEFSGSLAMPGGGHAITLRPEQIPAYLADKTQFAADYFGISKAQYLRWVETDGSVRCSRIKADGTPCRSFISGPIQLPISEWLKREGGYCAMHGGKNAIEAREPSY
jgi:hypothetical protein